MTAFTKNRLIGGAWATAASVAGITAYRHYSSFQAQTPCAEDAVQKLSASEAVRRAIGQGDLRIPPVSQRRSLDRTAGMVCADFKVRGPDGVIHIFYSGKRDEKAQKLLDLVDDDEDLGRGTWGYYYRRPWELKALFKRRFRAIKDSLKFSRSGDDGSADSMKEAEWHLDTLFFVPCQPSQGLFASIMPWSIKRDGAQLEPVILLGNGRGVPAFESMTAMDWQSKGDGSRRRLQYVGMGMVCLTALACTAQLIHSVGVGRRYGFTRRAILGHPLVKTALGPHVRVQTTSGTFGSSYVNAKLSLVGEGGSRADVEFAAMRDDGGRKPWRVVLARMTTPDGVLTLDRAHF